MNGKKKNGIHINGIILQKEVHNKKLQFVLQGSSFHIPMPVVLLH